MSSSKCRACGELLKEGEEVTAKFDFLWHVLKSDVAFAVDKSEMSYVHGTLRHLECPCLKGE